MQNEVAIVDYGKLAEPVKKAAFIGNSDESYAMTENFRLERNHCDLT